MTTREMIESQTWYINNLKLSSYLKSEWFSCIPVSESIFTHVHCDYMYAHVHEVSVECIY